MKKNVAMLRKVGGMGLAGAMVFGAAQTQAETFTVTADVQNTLAVTVVQEMNLGTLFAAEANGSAVSALTLAANGDMEEGTAIPVAAVAIGDEPSFLTLGGQQAARASVATDAEFSVELPTGATSDLETTQAGFVGVNNLDNDVIEVRIAGGDPDVARFYLVDFVIGDPVDGTATVDGVDPNVYNFNPDFGVAAVEFGIGATIYTDGSGTRTAYEAGTYEGTFEVTASF